MIRCGVLLFFLLSFLPGRANFMLVPMDEHQKNHLKAYGIAYLALQKEVTVDWLLNYRGGSFLIQHSPFIQSECTIRGVSFEILSAAKASVILNEIESPAVNMSVVRLETAPKIAVYSPKNELINDETDAVIIALDYSEIPYSIIYDEEIVQEELAKYDWLHLHHEDFTGQRGKNMRGGSAVIQATLQEATAQRLGFASVPKMKLAIAKKIKTFCAAGGYLFAMCSGAETFDIALTLDHAHASDGDDTDEADIMLEYENSLAFENFTLEPANSRKFSDINTGRPYYFEPSNDFFQLFTFSAKWDIVPAMLTQNHTVAIREFSGQTTAFNPVLVKADAVVLGENKRAYNVRYLYGEIGRGHWTYYSGHDPESTAGRRRGPTDLSLYSHSPGYRLILNNVLFPSAKKKKQKT